MKKKQGLLRRGYHHDILQLCLEEILLPVNLVAGFSVCSHQPDKWTGRFYFLGLSQFLLSLKLTLFQENEKIHKVQHSKLTAINMWHLYNLFSMQTWFSFCFIRLNFCYKYWLQTLFKIYLFIYWAAQVLFAACGINFPELGSNSGPLHRELGV